MIFVFEGKIRYQCKKAHLKLEALSPQTVGTYVLLPTSCKNLSPAKKSDIIRCALLNKYGGIWLDTDLVGTGDFNHLHQIWEKNSFFSYYNDDGYLMCCLISKPGTLVTTEWLSKIQTQLKRNTKHDRLAFGASILSSILHKSEEVFLKK